MNKVANRLALKLRDIVSIVLLMVCGLLVVGCNSGGGVNQSSADSHSNISINGKATTGVGEFISSMKPLGWHVFVNNASTESYVVTSIGAQGGHNWDAKDLNSLKIIESDTMSLFYTEAKSFYGIQSFLIYQRANPQKKVQITLHQERNGEVVYITNDSNGSRGYAEFNHGFLKYRDERLAMFKDWKFLLGKFGIIDGVFATASSGATAASYMSIGLSTAAKTFGKAFLPEYIAWVIFDIGNYSFGSFDTHKDMVTTGVSIESDGTIRVGVVNGYPIGSYLGSCTSLSLSDDGILKGYCDDAMDPTELNLKSCDSKYDILSRNGQLSCIREAITISNLDIRGLSVTKDSIYAFSTKTLYKCDWSGSCRVIDDSFVSNISGISFANNGKGFLITKNGSLDLYENDRFIDTVHTFADHPMAISYVAENGYVYVGTLGRELKKCSPADNYDNCVTLDNFQKTPRAVAFSFDGSGFVLTGDHVDKYSNTITADKETGIILKRDIYSRINPTQILSSTTIGSTDDTTLQYQGNSFYLSSRDGGAIRCDSITLSCYSLTGLFLPSMIKETDNDETPLIYHHTQAANIKKDDSYLIGTYIEPNSGKVVGLANGVMYISR